MLLLHFFQTTYPELAFFALVRQFIPLRKNIFLPAQPPAPAGSDGADVHAAHAPADRVADGASAPRGRRRQAGPAAATAAIRHTMIDIDTIPKKSSRAPQLAKFRQNVAGFRLYRHRFLQENMRLKAFFKIYQIIKLKFLNFGKIL